MTKRKLIQFNRKWHRYLGLVLGIQFFFWTLGGLYFSWTTIEEIRGDHLKTKKNPIPFSKDWVSPSDIAQRLGGKETILSMEAITILQKPAYRFVTEEKVYLFDAHSGNQLEPLGKATSVLVAQEKLNCKAEVISTEYLTKTGKHHEYRGRPLPAYAVTFGEPVNTTVYVATAYGEVQTFRSDPWRFFDFLWMMHTMDYQERDNFNNLLLRAFSIFGLFTILSGFSLYYLTSKKITFKPRQ